VTPDTGFRDLRAYLAHWDDRRRLQTLLDWLPRALAAGLLPGLGLALLARMRPLLTAAEIALAALAIAVMAVAVAVLIVLVSRRSLAEQARFADRRFALRERATAAVEIRAGQHDVPPELAARQLGDAVAAAAAVDTARQMPLTTGLRDWLPALLALAALLLALGLPNPQQLLLLQQRAVAAAMGEQAAALESLSEQIRADASLSPSQQAALQRPLEEALATLNEPGVSPAEAMAALSAAEAELRSLTQEFDEAAASASVAAAADALSRSEQTADFAAALEAGDANAAADAVAGLADRLPQMDAAARAELAQSLADAADAMRQVSPGAAAELDRVADALAAGDIAEAQAALDDMAASIEEAGTAARAAARAEQAAEAIGQSRQSVAAAGAADTAGDTQAATGAAGAGEQAGSGGQTGGEGQSSGSGQQGNGQEGQGAAGQGQGSQGTATGGPSEGSGHVENVFVPAPVDLSGQGENVELEVQCLSDPTACGPQGELLPNSPDLPTGGSFVPFDQVFGDYRDAAFEALPGSGVPPALQGLVRDYFSALEP